MPKLKSTKTRVLVTLDDNIVKILKRSNINVSRTINDLLGNHLIKGFSKNVEEINISIPRFLKSSSYGI